jgi:hypothetical protein
MAHSRYGTHRAPQHNNLPPNPCTLPFDIMPRSVQPGGLARQMCVRYTARRKLGLLTAVERLQHEEGLTLRKAAERLLVWHSLIVRWKKKRSAGSNDPFVALIRTSKNKKATHAGPLGQLKEILKRRAKAETVSLRAIIYGTLRSSKRQKVWSKDISQLKSMDRPIPPSTRDLVP